MFKYWTALYLSTFITKFTQHRIEHGVLDNEFNSKISTSGVFFAYCMYVIFPQSFQCQIFSKPDVHVH